MSGDHAVIGYDELAGRIHASYFRGGVEMPQVYGVERSAEYPDRLLTARVA